jgi:penicillin-binding protein 2
MSEIRNVEQDLHLFRTRVIAAGGLVLLCFALLCARLVWLQVVRHDDLALQAEANRITVVPLVPTRGQIVDRNGVVLASSFSAYTLEVSPRLASADLERLVQELQPLVEISTRDLRRFRRLREEFKGADMLPLRTRLSDAEVARFLVQRHRFPGVDVSARLFRHYPMGETGAHLVGTIGRINEADQRAMEDWDEDRLANYRGTEVIGKSGLEQAYEQALHGLTGFEEVETSAGGRPVRRLGSRPSTPGDKLVLSVDIRLQALVEQLFGDRRGALVALDPRNGEVLALVSMPSFDPNLFVGGIDVESWRELNESIDRPLVNRALRGTYPPGSTFKPFMAMAALHTGKRTTAQTVWDGGTFELGNHVFRSHGDTGLGMVDLRESIVKSSNVYYYTLAHEMGVDLMHAQLTPFGFGQRTGIDLEGEAAGVLPSTDWKRRQFKRPEQQRWYAGETISLGIGQGYNSFTMLQLASATATLVSGGQRYQPRLVREIEDPNGMAKRATGPLALPALPLKPAHVAAVREALHAVTTEGTAAGVFAGAPYASGGKTGTAQAVGVRQNERYDAARLEERKRDHSLYMAAAPIDAPSVALAVIVENAGFGSRAAAPIARRVFDYLLLGQYPSDEDIAAVRAGRAAQPLGTPRPASEVPLPGIDAAAAAARPDRPPRTALMAWRNAPPGAQP